MKFLSTLGVAGAVGLAMAVSGVAVAQECKPSKWGADDEIGAANYVTPAQVLAATKLVRQGRTHPLGIVLDPAMPAYPPRSVKLQIVQPHQQGGHGLFGYDVTYNDDMAQLWFGVGPQIDGFGHAGIGGIYYNCNDQKDFADINGLKKLSIANMPPMVGRGILIDMAKHFGKDYLDAGHAFNADDIKAAAAAQGVEIREGDVVLFHTGWTDAKLASDPKAWVSGEPGTTTDAARYLASKNVMAVGADTWGVDVIPPPEGAKIFYSHQVLLRENGIYILEVMNTGPLAKQGVYEFMFVLGQPRIKGTVQMIINPVAMW